MKNLIKQAIFFLDNKQKTQAVALILLMLVAALTELIGLGLFLLLLNFFLGISNTFEVGFFQVYFYYVHF